MHYFLRFLSNEKEGEDKLSETIDKLWRGEDEEEGGSERAMCIANCRTLMSHNS